MFENIKKFDENIECNNSNLVTGCDTGKIIAEFMNVSDAENYVEIVKTFQTISHFEDYDGKRFEYDDMDVIVRHNNENGEISWVHNSTRLTLNAVYLND